MESPLRPIPGGIIFPEISPRLFLTSQQNTGCLARKYWLDLIYSGNLLKKNSNEEQEHEIDDWDLIYIVGNVRYRNCLCCCLNEFDLIV